MFGPAWLLQHICKAELGKWKKKDDKGCVTEKNLLPAMKLVLVETLLPLEITSSPYKLS